MKKLIEQAGNEFAQKRFNKWQKMKSELSESELAASEAVTAWNQCAQWIMSELAKIGLEGAKKFYIGANYWYSQEDADYLQITSNQKFTQTIEALPVLAKLSALESDLKEANELASTGIEVNMILQAANSDLKHELARCEILIKMADELITNENAKADWQAAKKTRHQ